MNEEYFISRSYDDLRELYLILDKNHSQNLHTIYTYITEITKILPRETYDKNVLRLVNSIRDSAFPARDYDKLDGKKGELLGFWARTILNWENPKLVQLNWFQTLYINFFKK